MSIQTINVPDIGDYKNIPVIEILVKVGDVITIEQSICTLESDKATMEVPANMAGVVEKILIKIGDKVSQGTPIININSSVSAKIETAKVADTTAPLITSPTAPQIVVNSAISAPKAPVPIPTLNSTPATLSPIEVSANLRAYAGPSVRQLARELGVDLSKVVGSGRKSRIMREDVNNFVKKILTNPTSNSSSTAISSTAHTGGNLNLLDWPKIDFTKFGEIESKPLSRIKKISGANLHRNWVMIPHVTQHDEADITELESLRIGLAKEAEKTGVKVTMLAFLIKAVVSALQKQKEFNASLDGENLILKKYFNIGVAVDTPDGLMVPVIRDCDKKGVFALSKDLAEISILARAGKLKPTDMQGGCFTISSLGGIGGHYFTPIINAPEVAILGVSRSRTQYIPNRNGGFSEKLMLPLSLSYDHRVIDGAAAARFISNLGAILTDMRRALL